ncbi:MAG: hypothetical protein V1843_03505 [bacterium]
MVDIPRYIEDSIVRTASELALNRLEQEYQYILREHSPSNSRIWFGFFGSLFVVGLFGFLSFASFRASGGLGGGVVYREGMLLSAGLVIVGALIALGVLLGSWSGFNAQKREAEAELERISSEIEKHRKVVDRRIYFS